jgi:hypothetical protein
MSDEDVRVVVVDVVVVVEVKLFVIDNLEPR